MSRWPNAVVQTAEFGVVTQSPFQLAVEHPYDYAILYFINEYWLVCVCLCVCRPVRAFTVGNQAGNCWAIPGVTMAPPLIYSNTPNPLATISWLFKHPPLDHTFSSLLGNIICPVQHRLFNMSPQITIKTETPPQKDDQENGRKWENNGAGQRGRKLSLLLFFVR